MLNFALLFDALKLSIILLFIFTFNTFGQLSENMTGVYTGFTATSITLSNCTDPDDNGSLPVTSRVLNITETSPGVFSGTLNLTVLTEGGAVSGSFAVIGTSTLGNPRSLGGQMQSQTPPLTLLNGNFTGNWSQSGNTMNLTINLNGTGSTGTGQCSYIGALPMSAPAPPRIEITLEANNTYLITAEPRMPSIRARAKVVSASPDPTATTQFRWTIKSKITSGSNPGLDEIYDEDIKQNQTTVGNNQIYTFELVDTSAIRGGTIQLSAAATLSNGQVITGFSPALIINGTNPGRLAISSHIDAVVDSYAALLSTYGLNPNDVKDALKRIACRESGPSTGESGGDILGQRQFRGIANGGTGDPIISFDNGAGIFQITRTNNCSSIFANSACRNTIYDWRANIAEGVKVFISDKIVAAYSYPDSVRKSQNYGFMFKHINNVRYHSSPTLPNIPATIGNLPAPNFTNSGLINTTCTNGIPCNQLLEAAVRGFNGNSGTLVYRGKTIVGGYREFMPDFDLLKTITNITTPPILANQRVWKRVPGALRPGLSAAKYYFDFAAGTNIADCTCSFTAPNLTSDDLAANFSPTIDYLREIIRKLPDSDFVSKEYESRRELLALVDETEKNIAEGNNQTALELLNHKMKLSAEGKLKDYVKGRKRILDTFQLAGITLDKLIRELNVINK